MGSKGIVASTAALAVLLQEGIGDTIRISLTPEPDESRTREVIVAQELLQTMGLRAFTPLVTACPGCGRTTSVFFQELAKTVQEHVRAKMPEWRVKYDGVENLTLAVMGCVVNGPGESKHANIGISLPGTGEAPAAPVFIDGVKAMTLRGENIAQDFVRLIDDYIERNYARASERGGLTVKRVCRRAQAAVQTRVFGEFDDRHRAAAVGGQLRYPAELRVVAIGEGERHRTPVGLGDVGRVEVRREFRAGVLETFQRHRVAGRIERARADAPTIALCRPACRRTSRRAACSAARPGAGNRVRIAAGRTRSRWWSAKSACRSRRRH